MQYINPNYHSWVALPLIDVRVDNDLINNVFVGIDEIEHEYIYVLINNYGNTLSIDYIQELKNSSDYVSHDNIDVDLVLFKFKIENKEDYKKLICGNHAEISTKYHTDADDFIADCVRNTRKGFFDFYKILFLILDNSEQLIPDYWELLFNDSNNWLINEIKNSGKYFSAVSPNSNNLFTNYSKNVLKPQYEFSI